MVTLTEYQERAYPIWKDAGFRGIIRGTTGSGKTILGCECIRKFREEYPNTSVVIVTTAGGRERKVVNAWKNELRNFGIEDVDVFTYLQAANMTMRKRGMEFVDSYFHKDDVKLDEPMYDLMIADECHHLANPQEGKVMQMNPIFVLGLSATPEESTKILGEPIDAITVDEARVCPFTVHMVRFDPTIDEMERYNRWDKAMKEHALKVSDGSRESLPPGTDGNYDFLTMKRREACYTFESRIPIAVNLVKKHIGERTVIFTERTIHAHKIERALLDEGIRCSMNVKDKNTFKDFEEHRTNVLVMVKSLREGWDDPTLSVCIMASLSTRPKIITQTMGRTMRINPTDPSKHAHNYLLLANGTSDHRVKKSLDYPNDKFKEETPESLFDKELEEF